MILVFNAPPSAGKDFSADFFASYYGATKLSFKTQLIKDLCAYYNIEQIQYDLLNHPELKEEPSPLFGGLSLRQALIHVSENVVKKEKGDDWYGKCVSRQYMDTVQTNGTGLFVISDGGVLNEGVCSEFQPLLRTARYYQDNVFVVQIHRSGCTFSGKGDSRSYIGNRTHTVMQIAAGDITVQEDSVDAGVGKLPIIELHNNLGVKSFERVLTAMAKHLGLKKSTRVAV